MGRIKPPAPPPLTLEAVRRCFDTPVFDEEGVRRLFEAVKLPPDAEAKVHLSWSILQRLTASFALDRWEEVQPSAPAAALQAQRLSEACRQVLAISGAGDAEPTPENLHPFFAGGGLYAAAAVRGEPSGAAAVDGALRGVYHLMKDAERLAAWAKGRERINPAKAGRPESVALKRLMAGLGQFYAAVWEEEPGAAVDPPGPFMRLALGVTAALRARLGNHAFPYTSAGSLSKLWSGLDPEERGKLPTLDAG